MASKVISVSMPADVLIVEVQHLDSDSFSRSVDRAANAVWRRQPVAVRQGTRYVRVAYAHTSVGRTCVSTIAYGPSFEAASDCLPTT